MKLLSIGSIAAAYILFALLGWNFSIPPGYSCAVWYPAGIAVGSLFLIGAPALYGIFIGSVLFNAWLGNHDWLGVSIALLIASASSLQSYIAWRWVIARNGKDVLYRIGSTLRFAWILCCSCLIAASTFVLIMLFVSSMSFKELAYQWVVWYGGDLTGMLLIVPLVISYQEILSSSLRIQLLNSIIIFLVSLLTIITFLVSLPIFYIVFIFVTVAAYYVQYNALISVLVISLIDAFMVHAGYLPFRGVAAPMTILYLQAFLVTCCISILSISVLSKQEEKALQSQLVTLQERAKNREQRLRRWLS